MLLAFNINPCRRAYSHVWKWSPGSLADTICYFCTQRQQLFLEQSVRRPQVWQCSVLCLGLLLHLTFIVAPGSRELHANAIEAFSAKGPRPLSQRHHKSIHAKIIHFHWTPSMREQGEWRLRRWRQRHEERSREKGRWRGGFGETSVDIYGAPGG